LRIVELSSTISTRVCEVMRRRLRLVRASGAVRIDDGRLLGTPVAGDPLATG